MKPSDAESRNGIEERFAAIERLLKEVRKHVANVGEQVRVALRRRKARARKRR